MSKNLSAIYYQENKERLEKKPVEDIKISLKKKMKKSDSIVMNVRRGHPFSTYAKFAEKLKFLTS